MDDYYYDTTVFGYFALTSDFNNEYSPTKHLGHSYSLIFCNEKVINVYTKKGRFNYIKELNFNNVIENILNIHGFFEIDNINLNDINQKFLQLMGSLNRSNIDLRTEFLKYNNKKIDKPLDGMDWLHIATADLLNCNVILTTDTGFQQLKILNKYLNLDNIKKIIIFKPDKELPKVKEIFI